MLYSLFQSDGLTKDVFKNYILASPTFMKKVDGTYLDDYEEDYSQKTNILKANVYMTVGEQESQGQFLRPIERFVERVEKREYDGLNLTYKVYEGKEHYTVWVPSLLDGLSLFLKN